MNKCLPRSGRQEAAGGGLEGTELPNTCTAGADERHLDTWVGTCESLQRFQMMLGSWPGGVTDWPLPGKFANESYVAGELWVIHQITQIQETLAWKHFEKNVIKRYVYFGAKIDQNISMGFLSQSFIQEN